MALIKHKILVLSGKGGVGKSTFSSQLAFALQRRGKEVGMLDIDICGPSIPKIMGCEGSQSLLQFFSPRSFRLTDLPDQQIHQSNLGWEPIYVEDNLAVMSIGFLLADPNQAVIWRGPKKNSPSLRFHLFLTRSAMIKQFLKDVYWDELDFLVVDTPPGTSDEHLSITQYLKEANPDGAIIVTTPQEVSLLDVRKEINFCRKVGLPILGVVENMSGFVCGKCGVRDSPIWHTFSL